MADSTISVGVDTGKLVDNSQVTNQSGQTVNRQRVVIADPDDPTDLFSLDKLRFDRQLLEIEAIESVNQSLDAEARGRDFRTPSLHSRGSSLGRGATR
jgi:hypothetical protein